MAAANRSQAAETARRGHPSSPTWQPDRVRFARRFADVLAAAGAPCPEVGAAALAARSCTGLDRRTFARSLGIADADLVAVEAGRCPVERLPARLSRVAFFLRVLSGLRPLRLVRDDDPERAPAAQAGATATETGRPPVNVSSAAKVVRNTPRGVPAAAHTSSWSRRPSSSSTVRPSGNATGLTPPIG